jgi:hypothetical protein
MTAAYVKDIEVDLSDDHKILTRLSEHGASLELRRAIAMFQERLAVETKNCAGAS